MKKEVTKARNVFNCEAFHLEHITNMDEVRQLLKYELRELKLLIISEEDYMNLNGLDVNLPFLTKEEMKCAFRLYKEAKRVCERNDEIIIRIQFLFINAFYRKINCFDCNKFSLQHITTMDEVEQFADYLGNDLKLDFDPEKPFEDYIIEEIKEPMFRKEEAEIGNRLMKECIEVCEADDKDVYAFMGVAVYAAFHDRYDDSDEKTSEEYKEDLWKVFQLMSSLADLSRQRNGIAS